MDRTRILGVAYGLGAALIWGSFPVVTRLGLTGQSLTALDLTFLRFAVATLITWPWLVRGGLFCRPLFVLPLIVFGVGAPYVFTVSAGLIGAPVRQFAIITPPMMIVFSTLMVAVLRRSPPSQRVATALAIILAGVSLTAWTAFQAPTGPAWAYALFLLGALQWAIYTVTATAAGVSPMRATALISFWSLVVIIPPYLAIRQDALLSVPPMTVVTQGLWHGVMISVVALTFFSRSVHLLGPIVGATFAALVPGLATLYAALFLGERPGITALAGLALVSIGMVLAITASRRKHPVPATP